MLEFMPEEYDEMTTALAALTLQVAVRAAVLGCDRDCAGAPAPPAGDCSPRSPARTHFSATAAPAGVDVSPWGAIPSGAPGGRVGLADLESALHWCTGPGHAERILRTVCTRGSSHPESPVRGDPVVTRGTSSSFAVLVGQRHLYGRVTPLPCLSCHARP